jgi:hypothetical protein
MDIIRGIREWVIPQWSSLTSFIYHPTQNRPSAAHNQPPVCVRIGSSIIMKAAAFVAFFASSALVRT